MRDLNNESGRTMLEMLGVLAIMGVIMYGAIAGIGFGVEMYKINATYNNLEELSQGVIDLYSWNTGYPNNAGNISTAVCNNDVVSCTGTDIDSQWSNSGAMQAIKVEGAMAPDTPCSGDLCPTFVITHIGLPSLACFRLKDMNYANLKVITASEAGAEATDCDAGKLVLRSR